MLEHWNGMNIGDYLILIIYNTTHKERKVNRFGKRSL